MGFLSKNCGGLGPKLGEDPTSVAVGKLELGPPNAPSSAGKVTAAPDDDDNPDNDDDYMMVLINCWAGVHLNLG